MKNPDLADLINLWLKENMSSSFYIMRPQPEYVFDVKHLALIFYRGFGSQATIYEDHIVINDDNRNADGLMIMAADPRMFELLSNRLYILERGFIKAANSRVETAKRNKENGIS